MRKGVKMGKDPGLAALIAAVGGLFGLFGLGHIYVGAIGKGIALMLLNWILVFLGIITIPILIGFIILIIDLLLYFYQIYDAYSIAKK